MAINPPSDIVLDVARAADPARRQAAADRLAGLAASGAAESPRFAGIVEGMQAANAGCAPRSFSSNAAGNKAPDAYRAFEAFFLQSFIQSMLPKDAEATYGSGTAGNIWRSMSAEQLGQTIAEAGGIGIADRLVMEAISGAGRQQEDVRDSASAFSLASLSGAFRDWASYLPFLDSRHAGVAAQPASPEAAVNWAPDDV